MTPTAEQPVLLLTDPSMTGVVYLLAPADLAALEPAVAAFNSRPERGTARITTRAGVEEDMGSEWSDLVGLDDFEVRAASLEDLVGFLRDPAAADFVYP